MLSFELNNGLGVFQWPYNLLWGGIEICFDGAADLENILDFERLNVRGDSSRKRKCPFQ